MGRKKGQYKFRGGDRGTERVVKRPERKGWKDCLSASLPLAPGGPGSPIPWSPGSPFAPGKPGKPGCPG